MVNENGFSGAVNELSEAARKNLAEEKVYGKIPRDEIDRDWNGMIRALNMGEYDKFMKMSKSVQAYVMVLLNDEPWLKKEKMKRYFGVARYNVDKKPRNPSLSLKVLERIKDILEDRGNIHFSSQMVVD